MIEDWLDEMEVKNYTINDDCMIDVDGKVEIHHIDLTEFPDFIQFNHITKYFDCGGNFLISLRGCPKHVDGWFNCAHNKLESLEGCPIFVNQDFYCGDNVTQFKAKDVLTLCDVRRNIIVFG
jgi:hypothetical protein